MSVRTQTIHGTAPGDSTKVANQVAANLRSAGCTVEIGPEYENVTVRRYGMISVDLVITEPDDPESA